MQAASLPWRTGSRWVQDGWHMFRRQPVAMFTWALTVGFLVLIASMIQPIGPLLFVTMMPAITVMTLQACREIEAGKSVQPLQLFTILKKPGLARRLFGMGAVYVGAVLLAGALAFVPFVDTLREALQGIADDDVGALMSAMWLPIALFGLLYVSLAAMFWHAPALVAWRGLELRKALFFSGIACWRNKGAFAVYGFCWFAIVSSLELAGGLLAATGLPQSAAELIQMPFNFLAAAVLYCSFYSVYTTIFGEEAFSAAPATPAADDPL